MKKKRNVFDVKFDSEEQEIEDALPDAWEKLSFSANQEEELAFAKTAAANYFSKYAQVTIRISSSDLERIKMLAAEEGLSYQTYITSILHKLSTGRIKMLMPKH